MELVNIVVEWLRASRRSRYRVIVRRARGGPLRFSVSFGCVLSFKVRVSMNDRKASKVEVQII